MLSLSLSSLARRSMPNVRRNFAMAATCQTLPNSVVVVEYKYGPNMLARREPYHAGHL